MARIKTGVCPTCGKERDLCYFEYGVIKATMCVFCMDRYLSVSVIPRLKKNNDTSDDAALISSSGAVIGGFLKEGDN